MKTSEQVAIELGYDPSLNFVHITASGSVGFTAGKPEECEELAFRAVKAGYSLSNGLKKAGGMGNVRIAQLRTIFGVTPHA